MARLDPAVAAVRLAVRRGLADDQGSPVVVACSGGADSMALLAATCFELRRSDRVVIGAVVDHALQDGSAEHTAEVVARMAAVGADETASVRVRVDCGPRGVEAGARRARYEALADLARRAAAARVLLGHTLDDQAESVLIGLTQGSGGRSLAGMESEQVGPGHLRWARPLLGVTRETARQACLAEGIEVWDDPHNRDPRFLRSRVRHTVMPGLERELGPGVAAALARTGEMLRDDLDALDELGARGALRADFQVGEDLAGLAAMPPALRSRMLRAAAVDAGCPPRDLTRHHVQALERLIDGGRGETRSIDLPGPVRAVRVGALLRLERTDGAPPHGTP